MSEDVLEKWGVLIALEKVHKPGEDVGAECIVDLAAAVQALRPDATLGRMVREMPEGSRVTKEDGKRFSAVATSGCRNQHGFLYYSERCFADTPEAALGAALKAAQKGEGC